MKSNHSVSVARQQKEVEKEVDANDEINTEVVVEETVEITPMVGSITENVVEAATTQNDDAIDVNKSISEMVENMAAIVDIIENPSQMFGSCDECEYISLNDADLRVHSKKHDDTEDEECNLCGGVFKDIEGLYNHMETNHTIDETLKSKDAIIKKLGNTLRKNATEKKTMKAQNTNLKEMLEESTKEATTLKVQLEIQTNMVKVLKAQREKTVTPVLELSCKMCSQKFGDNACLKAHMKIHQAELEFHPCELCLKPFKTKLDLKVHLEKHCEFTRDVVKGHIKDNCSKCDKCKCSKCKVNHHHPNNHRSSTAEREVQIVAQESITRPRGKKESPTCRNGMSCRFLRQNRCLYFHPESAQPLSDQMQGDQEEGDWVRVQPRRPRQQQEGREGKSCDTSGGVKWCNAGNSCDKGRTCRFRHKDTQTVRRRSAKDFSKTRSEGRK